MKQISASATSTEVLHALLGHLVTAAHLFPEVLTELGENLAASLEERGYLADNPAMKEAVTECLMHLEQAGNLGERSGRADRKRNRLNSSHECTARTPASA